MELVPVAPSSEVRMLLHGRHNVMGCSGAQFVVNGYRHTLFH